MNYFVTGIDTDSGKTVVSAILCEALGADYWKPVQAGLPRDADTVRDLVTNTQTRIHPESYLLKTPASPHAAAHADDISIVPDNIRLPQTDNHLIIEGAGGCLVPLNDHYFIIDMIARFGYPVILVADLYLGSINHTLLTCEALKNRNIPVKGIVFNGDSNPESERIILRHSGIPLLLHLSREALINREIVSMYARKLKEKLK